MKSGYKSTEFYIALAAQVVAFLVLVGVISPTEAQEINAWVIEVVKAGFALGVLGTTAWKYIQARTAVKTAK